MTRLIRETDKVRVQVCRGMMCSSSGGGRPLEAAFERALLAAGILSDVELFCPTCMGSCQDGPCVRINGQKFFHVSPADIPELIQNEILPLLNK